MEKELKTKRNIIIFGIAILVIVLIGSTYAFFMYSKTIKGYTLTSGGIKAEFLSGSNSISLDYAYPISDTFAKNNLDKLGYIDFTVKGNVANIEEAVKYEIYLTEDSNNTLDPSYIKVYITDDKNQEIKSPTLYNSLPLTSLKSVTDGKVIYERNRTNTFIDKYRIYVWIDNSYEQNEINQTFSFKVNLYAYNADNEVTAVDKIKATYGTGNGLVAIDQESNQCENLDDCDIREYRYSGNDEIKNYVYFNCEADATEEDANSKCELWRIIGVFKDEAGEEHLKIVRNEILSGIFPETFEAEGTTYNIKHFDTTVHWNNKVNGTNNNDWVTSGLQYWLNTGSDKETKEPSDGYMSFLSKNAKDMIKDTKYYLGTVTHVSEGIIDTPKEAYANERAVEGCDGGIGPVTNSSENAVESNAECRVWANNQATWKEGKVALLYPSDYGFSTESSNWEIQLKDFESINSSSWMNSMPSNGSWLLSPSSGDSASVSYWRATGFLGYGSVGNDCGVRPTLYLKSNVKITSGDGTSLTPYKLQSN